MAELKGQRFVRSFDKLLLNSLFFVSLILFLISISLVIFGVGLLLESWDQLFGSNLVSINWEGTFPTLLIESLGSIAIGIAVMDLTKSILDAEIAEQRFMNVQERARNFLTRFLAVVIFALSMEVFIKAAQADLNAEVVGDIAMLGIAVAAMLVGLAVYVKFTAIHDRNKLKIT
ncbi:MAG: hypothetical protein JXB14_07655 [Candidatus Altiarchaeota archaeon]|nr:hypothetical protein [Candidatus Altiarchaeota archaeon]